jgi:hypothetical protein
MELEINSKTLSSVLNTMEMKGKYCGDNGLTNSSLGEFVKIYAVADSWRTGYYFCNGNHQTFVSYYLPAIVEENDDCVLNATILSKYLKSMKGDITLTVDDLCAIESETKSMSIPVALVHPYEAALDRYLKLTYENCIYTQDLGQMELKEIMLTNAVNISMAELRDAITTCETVNSGTYTIVIAEGGNGIIFMSSSNTGEHITTGYQCDNRGEASITVTSPIHKAFTRNGRVNMYFNNDFGETQGQPLVIVSTNVCLIRAPYVTLEVE